MGTKEVQLRNISVVAKKGSRVKTTDGNWRDLISQLAVTNESFPHRIISYGKSNVQFVRDLEGFEQYHLNNPGTLSHILTQTILLSFYKEERINQMVYKGQSRNANKDHHAPCVFMKSAKSTKATSNYALLPFSEIVLKSVPWLQGIILRSYGPEEGLKLIEQAKQKAAEYFMLN